MKKKLIAAGAVLAVCVSAGVAYAVTSSRVPTEFYTGHTHDKHGHAVGAPEHSGGLDRNGCHNGSVPYHCH